MSFPRKRESISIQFYWIPAFAGMTKIAFFNSPIKKGSGYDFMMKDFIPRGRATAALKLLNPTPCDSILDVGCSSGYIEKFSLIGRVKKVRGIDIDAEAIRYAKDRDGEEYYTCCNSTSLPFSDNEFNKVLCLDTLEHVEDEKRTIAEIARVLRPGGLLVLSVPNDFLNFIDMMNTGLWFRKTCPRFYGFMKSLAGRGAANPQTAVVLAITT